MLNVSDAQLFEMSSVIHEIIPKFKEIHKIYASIINVKRTTCTIRNFVYTIDSFNNRKMYII